MSGKSLCLEGMLCNWTHVSLLTRTMICVDGYKLMRVTAQMSSKNQHGTIPQD